jgi:hypothetical protein
MEFDCPMCVKKVKTFTMFAHIPQCYRELCHQANTTPYCTCDDCEGRKTHNNSTNVNIKKSPKEEFIPNALTLVTPQFEPPQKANMSILSANVCIVCEKKASPSSVPIPFINIGKHHQVMICIKRHLTEENLHPKIITTIDAELKYIETYGDGIQSIIDISDDEEYVVKYLKIIIDIILSTQKDEETNEQHCSGFKALNDTKPMECQKSTKALLWYEDGGHTYYFCKASHLLRHLIEYYGKQGKIAVNTGKGVNNRGKRKDSNSQASKKQKIQKNSSNNNNASK